MTIVDCWKTECRWNCDGSCTRGHITIDELCECEGYEDYRSLYTDSYWIACSDKKQGKCRKLVTRGKRIEYNGYVFYTKDKIDDEGYYRLTEERTGFDVGDFCNLKDEKRWEHFVEVEKTLPDVMSYPVWKGVKNDKTEET